MLHQNSVFHRVMKHIPWHRFDRLVDEHGSDDLVRKFTTRHQLIALLYGQIAGACSLRDVETTMASHKARLYHVGGRVPARSTFADANRNRSPLVFSGLFQHMLGMATRVTLGHSGMSINPQRSTWLLFAALQLAVMLRVLSEILPGEYRVALYLSAAIAWLACFLPWVVFYLPAYLKPRVDGIPG